MSLTYDRLRAGVGGDVVGVRSVRQFEPLGGPNDKIFPPTYGVEQRGDLKYAVEDRVVSGANGEARSRSVLIDSVASQANRYELALLAAIRDGRLAAPVTAVDFTAHGLYGIDRISDYEAPHRIFDALLRDSFDGADLFRDGVVGRAITDAVPRNATALLHHSPHTLVFGGWDSTGPKGGRGSKFERALTSEIVAYGIEVGVKTASRIDPAAVEKKAGPVYEADGDIGWTTDPEQARRGKDNKPVLYKRGGDKTGTPAVINHGNVTPSIDDSSGGVTAERIVGTTVLSFIQLRRLRFPTGVDGVPIPVSQLCEAEAAARTALAALGLAATVLAQDEGFDLRSRCVLVPTAPFELELVGRSGDVETVTLDAVTALALATEADEHAAHYGLGWRSEELMLRPSDRLVALIRRSQELSVAGDENI